MSFRTFGRDLIDTTNLTTAVRVSQLLDGMDNFAIQAVYSDATPDPQNFVAADVNVDPANSITITDHGFVTGLKVALTGTNLPSGLSETDYWIIKIDDDTIQLATSLANAEAGTEVTITTQGTTADAALTPAALAGNVLKLQMSNDNTNWTDIDSQTVTIAAGGSIVWNNLWPGYRYVGVLYTPDEGALNLFVNMNGVLVGYGR